MRGHDPSSDSLTIDFGKTNLQDGVDEIGALLGLGHPELATREHICKSRYVNTGDALDIEAIHKALSNETRRDILRWLKDPSAHFDASRYLERGLDISAGVCVGDIHAKTGLAQSVISNYLSTLQRAGLLTSERLGKWTYYRRDEAAIAAFADRLTREL